MKLSLALAAIAGLVSQVSAVAVYGQCGGLGYTGPTVCDGCLIVSQGALIDIHSTNLGPNSQKNILDSQCLPTANSGCITVKVTSTGVTTCPFTTMYTTYSTIKVTSTLKVDPVTTTITVTALPTA
ncbi:hypothetical protein M407DRAFT_23406 [Tulasnella calospora MUT 4182]|uniref:CBM1 domain-containing protein n=1 Tax=Tulasnella calospora MUT 4182 TaxID=1051891 RepID=A0A0C3QJP5_9AGAM|nr:hypothetical protein M407DRAFT_23406 [Tulasnella calospora MUT 4182]